MKLYTTDEVFIKETDDFPQNYTGMIESDDGTKRWYHNKFLHRDNDLPAIIKTNGHQSFFQNGKFHRENNPAIIEPNGNYMWYVNGCRNRIDGPAEVKNGNQYYWQNDNLHREDGPAAIIINNSGLEYLAFLPKKTVYSALKELKDNGVANLWFLDFNLQTEESVRLYRDMLKLNKKSEGQKQ